MRKDHILNAFKKSIANKNISKREGNKIQVLSDNNNQLILDKAYPKIDVYLEGLTESCSIALGSERYDITEQEYNDAVNIYNLNNPI